MGRVAQGVVTADRDQVIQFQPFDIFQYLRSHVVDGGRDSALRVLSRGKSRAGEKCGGFLHLQGVRARTVQPGPTRAVDSARVVAVQRKNVAADARRIVEVDVRQSLPSAPNAGDLMALVANRDRQPS